MIQQDDRVQVQAFADIDDGLDILAADTALRHGDGGFDHGQGDAFDPETPELQIVDMAGIGQG